MCTIEFQVTQVYLNPPNGILLSKVEKERRESISMFQTILNRKHVRQKLVNEPRMCTINDVPINWELMNMTDLTNPLTKENMQ
jgi:hypothetical protein